MQRITQEAVDRYLADDWIAALLDDAPHPGDRELTCDRWLRETPPKRLVFALLYGDLLTGSGRSVLDVGGGLTGLTRRLAQRHRLTILDLMAHDERAQIARFRQDCPQAEIVAEDWYRHEPDRSFDVVVANDLCPNVDQRLELFLARFVPVCRELRLSLTFYNEPRFYLTRRIDGEEILCMLAWTGAMTRQALLPYAERIRDADFSVFDAQGGSPYPNRRQVCTLRLAGGG